VADKTASGVSLPIELSASAPSAPIDDCFKSSIVYPNKRCLVSKSIFSTGMDYLYMEFEIAKVIVKPLFIRALLQLHFDFHLR
jgi:hypothetical protein